MMYWSKGTAEWPFNVMNEFDVWNCVENIDKVVARDGVEDAAQAIFLSAGGSNNDIVRHMARVLARLFSVHSLDPATHVYHMIHNKYLRMPMCDAAVMRKSWQLFRTAYDAGARPSDKVIECIRGWNVKSDYYEGLYRRYIRAICGFEMELTLPQIHGMSKEPDMRNRCIRCLRPETAAELYKKLTKHEPSSLERAREELISAFGARQLANTLVPSRGRS